MCLIFGEYPTICITGLLFNHDGVVTHSTPVCFPQAYLIYSSSVAAGAQSGIEECKYQFAWDRWNCPERALQLSTHSSLRSGKTRSAVALTLQHSRFDFIGLNYGITVF